MTLRTFALLGLVLASAGCGDDRGDGDPARDAGPRDAGARDAGTRDAGTPMDAGTPVDTGGDDAATSDAGSDAGGECCGTACPMGTRCNVMTCACIPDTDCCATIRCPPETRCDSDSCSCVGGMGFGCCMTGETCPEGMECSRFSCSCAPPPVCDPPCAGDAVCVEDGRCLARCAFFGEPCPDGTYCSETGCVPAACTSSECWSYEPIHTCEPTIGCVDACTRGMDWTWCTSMGGRCHGGTCVDDTCSSTGMFRPCMYAYDCCGTAYCQAEGTGSPPCPIVCPSTVDPVIRDDHCACATFGGCVDLRYGGGMGHGMLPPFPRPP